MFRKHALTLRIGPRAVIAAGNARVVGANRSRERIITAVWQRNPVSGRLELKWQAMFARADSSNADDVASIGALSRVAQALRVAA